MQAQSHSADPNSDLCWYDLQVYAPNPSMSMPAKSTVLPSLFLVKEALPPVISSKMSYYSYHSNLGGLTQLFPIL